LPFFFLTMKIFLIRTLQRLLGFERYLYVFSRYVVTTLQWNLKEKDFLYFVNLLKDNGIVLDVGANIGAMTTHLSRRLKNSKIFSFEPVPFNISTLKKIVKHYKLKNVCIMETALGNTSGQIEMIVPKEKNVKLHGLSHVMHDSINDFNEGDHFLAPVCTLDSIKEFNNGHAIRGIKIDVENYEYFVLDGARDLIRRNHPLIYSELWENENRIKCFNLLTEMGYSINILEHGKLILFNPEIHKKQNFFFIPPTVTPGE
jgi:FkbM family methyltransferase